MPASFVLRGWSDYPQPLITHRLGREGDETVCDCCSLNSDACAMNYIMVQNKHSLNFRSSIHNLFQLIFGGRLKFQTFSLRSDWHSRGRSRLLLEKQPFRVLQKVLVTEVFHTKGFV